MPIAALAGLTLIVSVSIQPGALTGPGEFDPYAMPNLSEPQKGAMLRPLVKSANECLARAVAADPRFGQSDFSDLIVDSFASCTEPVQALIGAYDHYYGEGTGMQFFMGPYLDALPAAVANLVRYKPK